MTVLAVLVMTATPPEIQRPPFAEIPPTPTSADFTS